MYIDRNNSKTQPYPPIETVEVIKSIKSKEKDRGWFKKWLKKDEEMRKRRSGISGSAFVSIKPNEFEGMKFDLKLDLSATYPMTKQEIKKLDKDIKRFKCLKQ